MILYDCLIANPSTLCYRCWCPTNDDAWSHMQRGVEVHYETSTGDFINRQVIPVEQTRITAGSYLAVAQIFFCCISSVTVFAATCPNVIGMSVAGGCCLLGVGCTCRYCIPECCRKKDPEKQTLMV